MHLFVLFYFFLFQFGGNTPVQKQSNPEHIQTQPEIPLYEILYQELGLSEYVTLPVFEQAFSGYGQIEGKQKEILTLIDFSKPSTQERLFVIDVEQRKLLFKSHVAHGRNSGDNYAVSFSNRSGSYQSSLGFYLTENTYIGKNGYSLVIDGLEKGINDNAKARAVVIHGASYANPSVIAGMGRLGRSLGCPALPETLNRPIIDTIKNGSVLYIHAEDERYFSQSSLSENKPLS